MIALSSLRLRIDRLEENIKQIKTGSNETGAEAEIVAGLVGDLRGLIGELRSVMSESASTEKEKLSLQVKYPVNLYGYIKLDASHDASRISVGNYARWVEYEGKNDDQFSITARQTRFGLDFSGPDVGTTRTSGKVEIDFYGGGEENKSSLLLRHAFMKVYWPNAGFSILAGQMSDLISPLFPNTLNYVVGWWAGNIGYRRPQLRFTKEFKLGEKSSLQFELAAARSIGGEVAGVPSFQGRSSLSLPLLTGKSTTIGISGHSGKEENDSHTWSANVNLALPLSNKITIQGEYWQGENLDAYLGGIGLGVKGTKDAPVEVASTGGWVALSLGPLRAWNFNIGGSIDDPDAEDLKAGDRTRNASIFGNILYNLNQAIQTGLEISYWDTKYKEQEDRNSFRVQWSWIYKF